MNYSSESEILLTFEKAPVLDVAQLAAEEKEMYIGLCLMIAAQVFVGFLLFV